MGYPIACADDTGNTMILQSADFAVIVSAVVFANMLCLAVGLAVAHITRLERQFGIEGAKRRTPFILYVVILGALTFAGIGAGLLVFA
jgi:hypothetical protein